MFDKITGALKLAYDIAEETKDLNLKSAILDLKGEILRLREENHSLQEQLSIREMYNMQFEGNVYYNVKEDDSKEGPFCSRCWDSDKKPVRLLKKLRPSGYECPNCNSHQQTIRPRGMF